MAFFLITNEGYNALEQGISDYKLESTISGLDVAENMIKIVEADESVHSVGIGAWPNMLGEMEFDASIMHGTSKEAGAIGAIKHVKHPISVAKKVLTEIPHAFLVGEGAKYFANEHHLEHSVALNSDALLGYERWKKENQLNNIRMDQLSELAWKTADPQKAGGTVVCLTQDLNKDLIAAVSTSGWAWKYPGRLGDSPVIGAGIYSDSKIGAAGCIGHGEVSIRTCAAKSVVQYMECGFSIQDACLKVAKQIQELPKRFKASIAIHAVTCEGEHFSVCLGDGVKYYYFWETGMQSAQKVDAHLLSID